MSWLILVMIPIPSPHPDTCIPPPAPTDDTDEGFFDVSTNAIVQAIRSFPNGSAGGPCRLHPQHLKDMLQSCGDDPEAQSPSHLLQYGAAG